MKKFTLGGALCLLVLTGFSQVECPSFFKVKNGGCAGSTSQMQLYWNNGCPADPLPIIDSVYYQGAKLNITFTAPDGSNCPTHNYVAYCVTSGNIPPATHLNIFMNFGDSVGGGGHGSGTINCDVVAGGPLPIIISSFMVNRTNNHVNVLWKTAQETDVLNYEVQRSYDNISFQTVATVASHNAPDNITTTYTYIDQNIAKNVSYYRIKVNDVHGLFTNTDTRAVSGLKGAGEVTIYPNPARDNSILSLSQVYSQATVQIIDNSGRLVQSSSLMNSNSFRLNNLTKGLYFVKIINKENGETIVQKITVAD